MSTSKRVTIAEVAKAAQVSISTVSRVLNQRDGNIPISEETKQTVWQAASRLGYQADPFASALRTRRSGVIGAIIRDLRDPFLIKILRALQSSAREKGLELLLGHADYDLKTAGRQLILMNSRWFDGLLLIGDIPGDKVLIRQLIESNKPFATVARGSEAGTVSIDVDEAAGAQLALDHLYQLGHRRIAFIGNPTQVGVASRLSYYQDYMKAHRLPYPEGYLQVCPNNRHSAAESTQKLLALPEPPTAIFAATDLIALGAISCAWQMGWPVPNRISICGFDDIDESAESFPPLTTIRQPVEDMAAKAIDLLMSMIDGASPEGLEAHNILPPQLINRESCLQAELAR